MSPKFRVPSVALVFNVTARAAEMLLVSDTTSPAVVPGTAAGLQLPAVFQLPSLSTFHEPLAADEVCDNMGRLKTIQADTEIRCSFFIVSLQLHT